MCAFLTKTFLINNNLPTRIINSNLTDIYIELSFLDNEYPDFRTWLFFKVFPDVCLGKRTVILKKNTNDEIIGLSILKYTFNEKKICTLWVNDKFSGKGVGSDLLEQSFKILKTTTPLITVSENRLNDFSPLFDKYNFTMMYEYKSYYRRGISEISYNHLLIDLSEENTIRSALPIKSNKNILFNNSNFYE